MSAIGRALDALRSTDVVEDELTLVWKRGGQGQWNGAWEQSPTLRLGLAGFPMADYAADFDRLLRMHHPEYCGLVGSSILGQSNLPSEQRLSAIIHRLWRDTGSFDVPEPRIEALLDDIDAFFDSPTLEVKFTAPLLNFSGPTLPDRLDLTPDLPVERLTDDRVTELFGGSRFMPSHLSARRFGPIEWAFTGTITDDKLVGERGSTPAVERQQELRRRLDRGLLALRTFKAGPVGYDFVRVSPVRFTPYILGEVSLLFGDAYVPFGSHALEASDAALLQRHAALVAGPLHVSLESACTRLADGEIRLQARDKLFDAVVGLEAILLADTSEKYRGELRYRFATNYATLFDGSAQRLEAFRLARKLYDLRSDIAHGTPLPPAVDLGHGSVTLGEAAARACEILRTVISRFLPTAERPPYLDRDYWLGRNFGGPPVSGSLGG